MAVSGLSVAYLAGGLVLVFSGLKNQSLATTIKDLAKGQVPPLDSSQPTIGIQDNSAGGSSGTTTAATGSIVQIAESYIGKLTYVYGGPPPIGTVDCSSFVSKVLNQAGVSSPGGSPYSPNTHGPSTISYLTWSGAQTVGNSASSAQPGDLVVWQSHMGICVAPGRMVSAQDAQLGVGESAISYPGEILFVRRLKSVPQVGTQTTGQPGKSAIP